MQKQVDNLKIAERGARLSILAYILLSIIKLIVGYIAESKALTADGINNSTDILASVAVLIGLRIAMKPIDEDHPYGHMRAETVASLISALIMVAVGLNVLINAIQSVINFKPTAPDMLSAYTAIFCSIAIYFVYRFNKKTAERINSTGLMAAAKDNLSDAWVGIGAAVGIIASQFGLPWIDPLAAVIVAILIIKTGWDIFAEATHTLMDGIDTEKLDQIAGKIKAVSGVNWISDIRARENGNLLLIDVSVYVNPTLTVVEGHDIADAIQHALHDDFELCEVIVHIEPDHKLLQEQ
ncbi:MAG: cation transporter [Bacillales bacterium]|jgi:cation diffusion facilitator family transporter|nr:cation transporter [Bacillales bacterium]